MTGMSRWFMEENRLRPTQTQTIIQTLEESLHRHQKKYAYHKKITQGYYEIIKQTELKLQQVRSETNAE